MFKEYAFNFVSRIARFLRRTVYSVHLSSRDENDDSLSDDTSSLSTSPSTRHASVGADGDGGGGSGSGVVRILQYDPYIRSLILQRSRCAHSRVTEQPPVMALPNKGYPFCRCY